MLLQADPTVKFSLQEFGLKRILFKHLEVDSHYNTYKYAGLPPGPIRVPSYQGLESVLNYTKHNYIYMCAKEDFSGTHNFAVTSAQHAANARKYQQALNRRGRNCQSSRETYGSRSLHQSSKKGHAPPSRSNCKVQSSRIRFKAHLVQAFGSGFTL